MVLRGGLQFHQPFGGKADHPAPNIGIRGLLHQRAEVHPLIGHRSSVVTLPPETSSL
jgi:hypothetical protein